MFSKVYMYNMLNLDLRFEENGYYWGGIILC